MTRRFALSLVALVVAVVLAAEVLLHPSSDDRLQLVVILAVPALVAAGAVPLLVRWVSTRRSVAGAALAVGLISLSIGTVITSAASNRMFLSGHDYRLFLVVLMLSGGLALLVGEQLSRPLADDIARLGHVATRVADGDLLVRTGIDRRDEVGQAAVAVDAMVERLREADAERQRVAAARQHLLTGVGHDLRTPLAAMHAAVEILQDGLATDPDRYLGVVASQLSTIEQMVDQLFVFARIEAGGPAPATERVSLTELADDAVESLSVLAERRSISLTVTASGAAFVDVAPADISRVIRNLVQNALQHTPTGSSVRIDISETDAAVTMTISDEGPGFDADFRDRAFEPFTRADSARPSSGSSGLGLAIAKALIDAHNGQIGIVDGLHGVVRFTLPRGPAHPPGASVPYTPVTKDVSS